MSKDDLGKSLIETIGKAGGTDLAADIGELLIDAVSDDGLLKDVPLVGSLLKLRKIGSSIKEHIFLKKLRRFLTEVAEIPKEDRESFADEISKDPELRERVGDALVTLLDRFDEIGKEELFAKAFSSYLNGNISFDDFFRIGRAIDRCLVTDLEFVHNYERATDAFSDTAFDLASCGLVQMVGMPTIRTEDSRNLYLLTDFGRLFIESVLRE